MILPLTGQQYSEKVAENCVAYWKSVGIYMDVEAKAIDKFLEVFKDETFPPGSSVLLTQSPNGSLIIGFSKDGSIPEIGSAVIDNKLLSEAILESIIDKHGVSPEAKQSLAAGLSESLKESSKSRSVVENGEAKHVNEIKVESVTFAPTAKPPALETTLFLGGAELGIAWGVALLYWHDQLNSKAITQEEGCPQNQNRIDLEVLDSIEDVVLDACIVVLGLLLALSVE